MYDRIFHGTDEIIRVYKGGDKIWEKLLLPSGYQRIEYIESTGEQYIDTGYIPSDKTSIKTEYLYEKADTYGVIFGCCAGSPSATYAGNGVLRILPSKANAALNRVGWGDTTSGSMIAISSGAEENTKYSLYYDKAEMYIDGVLVGTSATGETAWEGTYPIYLFARNTNGAFNASNSFPAKARIYSFQCFDDEKLALDLIPCVRIADGKPGFYDSVTDSFLTNGGTGEFLHGNPHLPSGYRAVEYIESDGNQYIDTGYIPKGNDRIELTASLLELSGNPALFGTRTQATSASADSNGLLCFTSTGSFRRDYYGRTINSLTNITVTAGTKYDFVLDKGSFYLNGALHGSRPDDESFSVFPIWLFCFNTDSQALIPSKMRLYSFSILEDGILKLCLIPCIRESDSKPGLYDAMTGAFLVNQGSGEFAKGADV